MLLKYQQVLRFCMVMLQQQLAHVLAVGSGNAVVSSAVVWTVAIVTVLGGSTVIAEVRSVSSFVAGNFSSSALRMITAGSSNTVMTFGAVGSISQADKAIDVVTPTGLATMLADHNRASLAAIDWQTDPVLAGQSILVVQVSLGDKDNDDTEAEETQILQRMVIKGMSVPRDQLRSQVVKCTNSAAVMKNARKIYHSPEFEEVVGMSFIHEPTHVGHAVDQLPMEQAECLILFDVMDTNGHMYRYTWSEDDGYKRE